jgi:hypothetical protein
MERVSRALRWRPQPTQAYEPLDNASTTSGDGLLEDRPKKPFSWLEYGIFLLLGVSMLWAWYVSLVPVDDSGVFAGPQRFQLQFELFLC